MRAKGVFISLASRCLSCKKVTLTACCEALLREHIPALESEFDVTTLGSAQAPEPPLSDGFDAICAAADERLGPAAMASSAATNDAHVPLLIVATKDNPEREQAALEAGAADFVSSDACIEVLTARILRCVLDGRGSHL